MADDKDRIIAEQASRIKELEQQLRELAQQMGRKLGSEARFPKRIW